MARAMRNMRPGMPSRPRGYPTGSGSILPRKGEPPWSGLSTCMHRIIGMTPNLSNSKAVTAREEGSVLLLVILILTLISVLVLSWAQEWRTELKLASNFGEAHKCHRLAEAGVYFALGKMVIAQGGGADRV